jgi:ferredoxin-NADP reductase
MAAKARDGRARVVARRTLARAILEVDLAMEDPPSLEFAAGQWISVAFGPKSVRAYTIASTPRDGTVITLCADVAPGGVGSRWFIGLAHGDEVRFKGPLGGFTFDRADPRRPLFVAEEIGIVPIRSMLVDLDESGSVPPGRLVHWAPTPDALVYADRLAGLGRRHPGFVYHPVMASPGVAEVIQAVAADTAVAYVAGGEGTIKRVREVLLARGLDRKAVKWERFW